MDFFLQISTHTPHARRDPKYLPGAPVLQKFLLTRLMRGVTQLWALVGAAAEFLLTRLMRGVTGIRPGGPGSIQKFLLTRLMRGVTVIFYMRK